jgi:ketopantoate reductase
MLYDIQHHQPTEVEYLAGAVAREAERAGVPAPLHAAIYRMIKAKEESWKAGGER